MKHTFKPKGSKGHFDQFEKAALKKLGYGHGYTRANKAFTFRHHVEKEKYSWTVGSQTADATIQKKGSKFTAVCQFRKFGWKIKAEIDTTPVTVYTGHDLDEAFAAIDNFILTEKVKREMNPDHYKPEPVIERPSAAFNQFQTRLFRDLVALGGLTPFMASMKAAQSGMSALAKSMAAVAELEALTTMAAGMGIPPHLLTHRQDPTEFQPTEEPLTMGSIKNALKQLEELKLKDEDIHP